MAVQNLEEQEWEIYVPVGARMPDDGMSDIKTNTGLFATAAITSTPPRPVEQLFP